VYEWPFGEFGGIILKSREVAKAAKGTFLGPTSPLRGTFLAVLLMKWRSTVDLHGPTRLKSELRTKTERRPVAKLYNRQTEG
jgi:hypothetical protein